MGRLGWLVGMLTFLEQIKDDVVRMCGLCFRQVSTFPYSSDPSVVG